MAFELKTVAALMLGLFVSAAHSQSIANFPLANQKNCNACHAENTRIAGPSWAAIREKYNHLDTNYLVQKTLRGGANVWGRLPMPSNSSTVTENEAQILIAAIGLPRGSQPTIAAPVPAPIPATPAADDPKVFGRSARGG